MKLSQLTQDVVELVQVVLPRKDRPVRQHLSQDAAHRPDVNGLRVALRHKHTSGIYTSTNKQINKLVHISSTPTFELSMISGALYQRVATYSVKNPVWSCSGSAIRARPKSQIWGGHKGSGVRRIHQPADLLHWAADRTERRSKARNLLKCRNHCSSDIMLITCILQDINIYFHVGFCSRTSNVPLSAASPECISTTLNTMRGKVVPLSWIFCGYISLNTK